MVEDLEMGGEWGHLWNKFITGLEYGRIRLTHQKDSLIWSYNRYAGDISIAMGYDLIVHHYHEPSPEHTKVLYMLWYFNIPAKIRCFIWLVVMNRVLTWDNLQRRGWQGPGICTLCRLNEDSVQHLFLDCTISNRVFIVFCEHSGLPYFKNCSVRTFLEHSYKNSSAISASSYLSLFIFWSLWKMRNSLLI